MKRIILSLSTLAALAIGTAAIAQPGGAKKADTNGDGAISFTEFAAKADARFTKADTNRDNVVTAEERKAARAAHRAERRTAKFDKVDANGDGFVSRAESDAMAAQRAGKMAERKDKRAARRAENGDKAKMKRTKGEGGKKANKRKKRDANAVVTRADHDARVAALFAKMDKNSDGVLSGDELKRKKRRGKKSRR